MRRLWLKVEACTTGLATALACAMLVIASALGMWQIITRFVIERPAEWTEVLIRFSLIWMVFLGIPMAFRIGAMVSVDVVYRWSSPPMRRVLDFIVCAAALVLVGVIIYWGWDYANRGVFGGRDPIAITVGRMTVALRRVHAAAMEVETVEVGTQ